jgi:crotonobetainyl-CoA:carnitine CoA-transferase CaiB-like acyl-CoA transferase
MGPFPGGRPDIQQSALYENCNAGKLGLAVDMSSPAGQEVIRKLVAGPTYSWNRSRRVR